MLLANTIAIISLFLASLEDLKTREVPDWLTFGLMFFGIIYSLIYSIVLSNWSIIVNSIAGFIVCIALGYFMFYSGQWGGGDSKLLMGLGALLGLDITFKAFPVLGTLIINIMIVGAIYGLLYTLVVALMKLNKFKKQFKKNLHSDKIVMLRKSILGFIFIMFILILLAPIHLKIMLFALMIFIFFTFYMWILVKSVEEACMIIDVPVSKLTEGDWVVNDVKVGKKLICSKKDLGLKKEQIAELKKLKVKKVTIKQGVPFVPSFFLGFIATLILGPWFLYLI